MKKIVLILGILASAYSVNAAETEEVLNNDIIEAKAEEDFCRRTLCMSIMKVES